MIKKVLILTSLAVAVIGTAVGSTLVSAAEVTVLPGESIQDAINNANPGDIITVEAGTYPGPINVTESVTLRGAQAGVDARSRTGAETIITPSYSGGFNIRTEDVTIDGFTIDGDGVTPYGRAIVLFAGADVSNLQVSNNIIKNNQTGIVTAGADVTLTGLRVNNNLFTDNQYSNGAAGIFIHGAIGSDVQIINNSFANTNDGGTASSNAISLAGAAGAPLSGVTISGNSSVNDGSFVYVYDVSQIQITNNQSQDQGGNGVLVGSSVSGAAITDNTFSNSNNGVRFSDTQPSSDVTISANTITGMQTAGVLVSSSAVVDGIEIINNTITGNATGVQNEGSAAIDANNNWWGCEAGPGAAGCDSIDGVVLASSWYTDATLTETNLDADSDETVPGVPNTSWANSSSGTLVALAAVVVATALGSVVLMRRRSSQR